jgi:hypothetical protein
MGPSTSSDRPLASLRRRRSHPRLAQSAESERLRPPRRRRFGFRALRRYPRGRQKAGVPSACHTGGLWRRRAGTHGHSGHCDLRPLLYRRTTARMVRMGSSGWRAACDGLPTTHVVTEDGPHPGVDLVPVARLQAAWFSRPVPLTCPKQRLAAVTNGQQRSAAVAPDLHQCLSMGGATVLPKLVLQRVGSLLRGVSCHA